MALWKEPATKDFESPLRDTPARDISSDKFIEKANLEKTSIAPVTVIAAPKTNVKPDAKESIIASDLTIEGKIEGSGHVRIAGRFKGDVHVEGNLTIESGARLTAEVRANTVVVGGELEGNIEAASRVELLPSGVLNGDLKAGSLIVAAGSRMRGRAEFGWGDAPAPKSEGSNQTGSTK